jgi:hypothetical protein
MWVIIVVVEVIATVGIRVIIGVVIVCAIISSTCAAANCLQLPKKFSRWNTPNA